MRIVYRAKDINMQWAAGEVCFDCPCGAREIIISEPGIEKACDCGRNYRIVHYVEYWEEPK